MPISWVASIFMVILFIMMLSILYSSYNFKMINHFNSKKMNFMKWLW